MVEDLGDNSDSQAIPLENVQIIARNEDYSFGVGQMRDRWVGFALGQCSEKMLFFFPEVSQGYDMGVTDRNMAILMTGALAQDEEKAYGGVEEWLVEESLRGDPEEYRCLMCGTVCCPGDCGIGDEDEEEDYP